jgi:hypothetical protein
MRRQQGVAQAGEAHRRLGPRCLRIRSWGLVLEGLSVIQVLLVIAANGLQGILGLGILPVVIAPVVFFYLTRPHVAAAFGRHARALRADRAGAETT